MEKLFYIFRHGQSSYNLAGRTQGQTNDSVLTEVGRQQAQQVGNRLKNKDIQVILCSPLLRTRQTAEIANQSLHKPVVYDNRFIEVNVGEVEGMNHNDIEREYGEKYRQWRSADKQYEDIRFDGGESKKEVRERVFSGLNEYAKNAPYQNIAIASHGIMLSQILIALGFEGRDIPNGSILCLSYDNDTWQVKGFI